MGTAMMNGAKRLLDAAIGEAFERDHDEAPRGGKDSGRRIETAIQ